MPRSRFARIDLPATAGIQDVFRHLANDLARTEAIASEAAAAFGQGRKVLVLTERTEHLDAIQQALTAQLPPPAGWQAPVSKYGMRRRAGCGPWQTSLRTVAQYRRCR